MSTRIDSHRSWTGEPPVSNAVLGTAIYVATALMFFGGLMSATLVLRAGAPAWPPPGVPLLPALVTGMNMVVLGASGILVWWAWRVRARESRMRTLLAAALLGTMFVGVQGIEWARLLAHGVQVSSGQHAATFYTLVGAHALHVAGGLAALVITWRRMRRGRGDLGACALYWGFVVLLWPVLYVLIYTS